MLVAMEKLETWGVGHAYVKGDASDTGMWECEARTLCYGARHVHLALCRTSGTGGPRMAGHNANLFKDQFMKELHPDYEG